MGKNIPSLTGLRFVAAAAVMFAHGFILVVPFAPGQTPGWYSQLLGVAAEGD